VVTSCYGITVQVSQPKPTHFSTPKLPVIACDLPDLLLTTVDTRGGAAQTSTIQ
jgi:hypothetical protein